MCFMCDLEATIGSYTPESFKQKVLASQDNLYRLSLLVPDRSSLLPFITNFWQQEPEFVDTILGQVPMSTRVGCHELVYGQSKHLLSQFSESVPHAKKTLVAIELKRFFGSNRVALAQKPIIWYRGDYQRRGKERNNIYSNYTPY